VIAAILVICHWNKSVTAIYWHLLNIENSPTEPNYSVSECAVAAK